MVKSLIPYEIKRLETINCILFGIYCINKNSPFMMG